MKYIMSFIMCLILSATCLASDDSFSEEYPVAKRLQGAVLYPYDIQEITDENGTHYQYKVLRMRDDTEQSQMQADIVDLVSNLSYADIDNHIDNVYGSLSVAQKASLKKLYKAVLYLLKQDTEGP